MGLEVNQIYNQDCVDGLKNIEAESVDLIIADPPYGIRYGENEGLYNRPKEGILEGYIDVPPTQYKGFSSNWMNECHRVLKQTGSIYVISGWQQFSTIETCLKDAGFTIINHIAWAYQFGVYTKRKYVTSFNPIIFAVKDVKKYKFYRNSRFGDDDKTPSGKSAPYKDLENVWYIPKERWEKKITTPTKLPYELVNKMILYSSKEEDLVLDPFMGSGQTAFVAKDLSRNFIGFEKNTLFWQFANQRLSTNQYTIPIKKS
jgi:site-specific DNA-methyltransferase (adenine-specific)